MSFFRINGIWDKTPLGGLVLFGFPLCELANASTARSRAARTGCAIAAGDMLADTCRAEAGAGLADRVPANRENTVSSCPPTYTSGENPCAPWSPQRGHGQRGEVLIGPNSMSAGTISNSVASKTTTTTSRVTTRQVAGRLDARMNSIIERWVKTLRAELLDCTLIWNQTHLRHALREYEQHYNEHRTRRSLAAQAPLRARPQPLEPGICQGE